MCGILPISKMVSKLWMENVVRYSPQPVIPQTVTERGTRLSLRHSVCHLRVSGKSWASDNGGFSMRVSEAVYTLAAIRRSGSPSRTQGADSPRSDAVVLSPSGTGGIAAHADTVPPDPRTDARTLAEMLHGHFVEEVRLRDRDGDGLLSLAEYASTPEEFDLLDADADGRIGAFDLVRAALGKNPDLCEIVAGPWAPIYSAIMSSRSHDPASLEAAARTGAIAALDQEPAPNSPNLFNSDLVDGAAGTTVDALMDQFLARHDRLDVLRSRLDDLASRLERSTHHRHIDRSA